MSDTHSGSFARSGDFSDDRRFDEDEVFRIASAGEDTDQIAIAMVHFIREGDEAALTTALAIYVRSARARDRTVDQTLAELNRVASALEGAQPRNGINEPSRLRELLMRALLLAFYGNETVDRYDANRKARRETLDDAREARESDPTVDNPDEGQ